MKNTDLLDLHKNNNSNCEADQRLCFRFTYRTTPPFYQYKICSFWPSSVLVLLGLCRSCSETSLLVFSLCMYFRCRPGWTGLDCQFPCPKNKYGVDCNQTCSCNHGTCSPEHGQCQCDPGYKLRKKCFKYDNFFYSKYDSLVTLLYFFPIDET